MSVLFKTSILTACFAMAASLPSLAHGGTYIGPGDTVPPGGSGGGKGLAPGVPNSGNPAGPGNGSTGTPAPGQPTTGSGPNQGGSNPLTGGEAGPDLTDWSYWWEFNKDPYINLKGALAGTRANTGTAEWFIGMGQQSQGQKSQIPTRAEVEREIVPALIKALETETNNDIVTGCLMGLGKIGEELGEDGTSRFAPLFVSFLADPSQEISETAAIALGILANKPSVAILLDLYLDNPDGRKLVARGEVPIRTRSFAAYGLALCGAKINDETLKADIIANLIGVLESERSSTRDIHVASVIALGLIPFERLGTDELGAATESIDTRLEQVAYLTTFMESSAHSFVRAHAPMAAVRLLQGAEGEVFEVEREKLARKLITIVNAKKEKNEVLQSAIQALGQLGDADPKGIDAEIRKALVGVAQNITDKQARYFAAIALAQVGGRKGVESADVGIREAQSYMLARLSKGNTAVRTWNALAIGVMGNALEGNLSTDLVQALLSETKRERTARIGAYAVSAGMLGNIEFVPILREKLDTISEDTPRGYLCLGLGMLGALEAQDQIRAVIQEANYRPQLLQQAAIALGLLQDPEAVGYLTDTLVKSNSLASQAALTSALGFIGDKTSIAPLIAMLEDDELSERARGFAAVALGLVGDVDHDLPWNTAIKVNINYSANPLTLNDFSTGTGVLNIL